MIGDRTRAWYDRANRLLLNHIHTQASKGVHYCCERNRTGEQSAGIPSRQTQELTAPLVQHKNAWAAEMAVLDLGDGVDPTEQKQKWIAAIQAADAEVQIIREWYVLQNRMAA